jgi:amino acid adenylation domain-containing protein
MSKFDLSFSFEEMGADLRLDITYNSDLFLPDRVARMAHQYERIVCGLLQDPQQSVAQLDILPPAERQQALRWCDRPAVEPLTAPTLPAWFERQASLNPDRIALVDSGPETRRLTYAELNEQANRLARSLRTRGVQTGERVGLYMDRGVDVVVSILGILKAGAAYVPLDPMYPAERVAFMIQDAELSHLVTRASLVTQIDVGTVGVLDLVEDARAILACASDNLGAHADSHDPAYVIYTSGSTGQPKGVVVTHANVTRLFHSTRNLFDFSNTDVWTLFHSYSFDFSVWEIWGALLYGGRLVVVSQELSRSPGDLLDLLAREKVTVLNQTPSAFQQLITVDTDMDSTHELALRYVIFGGETLDYERLRPWFGQRGDSRPELVNMYGITETTVHVTHRPIRLRDLDQRASLIGPPLPDLRLYIVDDHGQPSPLGVPGEIWVGGDGVARGYLHREQLTSEKFTIDPFRPGRQDRVYHSGDLGRLRPDGDIEYLGRIDSQVQVRGFRVELGEIEARLAMHPLVREAIVIADQQEPATRLVSYCLAATSQRPGVSDLRRFLTSHLPAYMVPSHFVFLDAFPLTVNGKLDRDRLPAPDGVTDPEKVHVAAANQTERMIAAAFASVLGVEQVSRDDNFFDLGAHSMSIITIHRQLQQEHGVDLSIIAFYEYPTVASLAMHLSNEEHEDDDDREATDRAALRLRARRRRRG